MKNLIIGVDADGVMTDMMVFNLRDGQKFFKKVPVNPNGYSPTEIFDVTKEDEFKFGLRYFLRYINKEPARINCSKVLNKLETYGDELHSITARKFVTIDNLFGEYNRKTFKKWLSKNDIRFKSIQFCSEHNTPMEKMIACSKLSVDVMIEDKPEVAMYLAENGVKVLLFDNPYNQGLEHKNMIRVNDWDEVYDQINIIRELKSKGQKSEFEKKTVDQLQKMSLEEKKDYFISYRKYLRNVKIDSKLFEKGKRRYKLLYTIGAILVKMIFKPRIIGKENIPYQGGFIIASNHENSNDQYLIDIALNGKPFTGFAAHTIKNTFRGKLFEFIKSAIFIDRESSESKKSGSEELAVRIAHDQIGAIFPEGTRKNKTEEGRKKFLLNFKLGAVSCAQKTGGPILPMALSYGKKYSLVRVGTPIIVKPEDDLEVVNQQLFEAVSKLKQENLDYIESKKQLKLHI